MSISRKVYVQYLALNPDQSNCPSPTTATVPQPICFITSSPSWIQWWSILGEILVFGFFNRWFLRFKLWLKNIWNFLHYLIYYRGLLQKEEDPLQTSYNWRQLVFLGTVASDNDNTHLIFLILFSFSLIVASANYQNNFQKQWTFFLVSTIGELDSFFVWDISVVSVIGWCYFTSTSIIIKNIEKFYFISYWKHIQSCGEDFFFWTADILKETFNNT